MSVYLIWVACGFAIATVAFWVRCIFWQRECDELERHLCRAKNDARTYEQDSEWWQRRYERLEADHIKLKADIRRLLKDANQ